MTERPRRLHLLVEGQTEETVVNQVLVPVFQATGLSVTFSTLVTKRPAAGGWSRGGATSWAKIAGDIRRLLGNTSLDLLTTIIDYYGFPTDAPGMCSRPAGTPYERVEHVETALTEEIGDHRFVPHLVLHELETWVYAAPEHLADLRGDPQLGHVLQDEAATAGGPELINEGRDTAPSKRLLAHCPDFQKTFDGPMVLADAGVDELRRQCPHMDAWLRRLGLSPRPATAEEVVERARQLPKVDDAHGD